MPRQFTAPVTLHVTPEQLELIDRAARSTGQSRNSFCKAVLAKAAASAMETFEGQYIKFLDDQKQS